MNEYPSWSSHVNGEREESNSHCIPPQMLASVAMPAIPPDTHEHLPAETQNMQDILMPVQYLRTAFDAPPYSTGFHQELVPHFSNADSRICYPFQQGSPYSSSRRCQIDHNESTYFKPDLITFDCHQSLLCDESSNVAHRLRRNQTPQQKNCFDNVLDYQKGTLIETGNWPPFGIMARHTYHPTNLSLSVLQTASRIETEHEDSHEEQLPEAAVSGASARLELQTSSSTLPSAVMQDLYPDLLTISQAVSNVWHTHFNSKREEFSSIRVAGADFKFLDSSESPAITPRLHDKASWQATWPYRMEMITSKNGRRIFPTLTVNVEGLEVDEKYAFFLDLMPKDQVMYENQSSRWVPRGALCHPPLSNQSSHIYVSRNPCENGSRLMACGVDFKLVKITNNACTAELKNQIFARSMQVYVPRYHIVRHLASEEASACQSKAKGLQRGSPAGLEHVDTYMIPETEFIAVTTYRNKRISDAKISVNPYAKAFRSRRRLLK